MAVGPAGGYLVWQDNGMDGPGKSFGIAARKLSAEMAPMIPVFRVNQIGAGLQENPQVALMANRGAAFVWQGGKLGNQDIYFRMCSPGGVLKPLNDLRVNSYTKGQQSMPVITCLSNGNLAVAWCSLHQDRSLEGVYARIVTPTGAFAGPYKGAQFQVNQFTGNNQKSPAITTLSNGYFIVVWISANQGVSNWELLRHTNRVHVYGRVFTKGGYPVSNEFRINTRSNICSSPSVAQWGTRGFTVTWAERAAGRSDSWDIYARTFSAFDTPVGDAIRVNEDAYGDQFVPKIGSAGSQQLVVWNSLGHDGSREGVFGRSLNNGEIASPEFLVNTHTNASQIRPVVARSGDDRFLVAWSSFMGDSSFDVRGQRYVTSQLPGPVTGSALADSEGGASTSSEPGGLPPLPGTGVSGGTGSTSSSALRVSITSSNKGRRLSWNSEPGGIYQVQYSTNFVRWDNLGDPRTSTAISDWVPVGNSDSAGFYRVIRVQ
jgi:hypothetical protein